VAHVSDLIFQIFLSLIQKNVTFQKYIYIFFFITLSYVFNLFLILYLTTIWTKNYFDRKNFYHYNFMFLFVNLIFNIPKS